VTHRLSYNDTLKAFDLEDIRISIKSAVAIGGCSFRALVADVTGLAAGGGKKNNKMSATPI
jgi:hypothetical protein